MVCFLAGMREGELSNIWASAVLQERCANTSCQVAMADKFFYGLANFFGSSVWNCSIQARRILGWPLDFYKIYWILWHTVADVHPI